MGIFVVNIGIDPRKLVFSIAGLITFVSDLIAFLWQYRSQPQRPPMVLLPILSDRFDPSAALARHYFIQDIWAAKRVFELAPAKHLDVGSRIDGFVAHVACFREIEVLDIRPIAMPVKGI